MDRFHGFEAEPSGVMSCSGFLMMQALFRNLMCATEQNRVSYHLELVSNAIMQMQAYIHTCSNFCCESCLILIDS